MLMINRINETIKKFTNILLVFLCLVVFAQVFFRYVVQYSLPWTEEIARYIMVWITFLGAALAVERGAHPKVVAFVSALPENIQKVVNVFAHLISILFYSLVVYYGYYICILNWIQPSPILRIPMGIIFIVFPISGLLLILNTTLKIYEIIKKGEYNIELSESMSENIPDN